MAQKSMQFDGVPLSDNITGLLWRNWFNVHYFEM